MHTQCVDRLSLKAGDLTDFKTHTHVDEPDLCRFRVIAKQLDKDV